MAELDIVYKFLLLISVIWTLLSLSAFIFFGVVFEWKHPFEGIFFIAGPAFMIGAVGILLVLIKFLEKPVKEPASKNKKK